MIFQFWWRFSFGDISVLAIFQFWYYFSFGDLSVLGTYQFWWHFSFCDTSVLVTCQFWWTFSFGDISVPIFQFWWHQLWWHFSFGDISVLVTFQFWWHFSFGDISVLVTFQFWCHFSVGYISVLVIFHYFFGGGKVKSVWTEKNSSCFFPGGSSLRGRGFQTNQNILGHFLRIYSLEFYIERRGGDQFQQFKGTFPVHILWIRTHQSGKNVKKCSLFFN